MTSRIRTSTAVVLVTVVAALLVGCSVPSRPAWLAQKSQQHTTPGSSRTEPAQPTVSAPPVRWKPGDPQLGVNVYWENSPKDSDATIRAKAQRMLNYAISLNANSISISFPFVTGGLTSTSIAASNKTPSPAKLALVLDEAAKDGMRATVRPIMNEDSLTKQDPKAWRGTIRPVSRDAWFRNYEAFILPYAAVSEQNHAATFVIATEFNSLQSDSRWKGVVQAVSKVFHGQLLYSMNFDIYTKAGTKSPVPDVGVDAYPQLDLPDSASVRQLVAGWNAWLNEKQKGAMPDLLLSEVGIPAQHNAYQHPGDWGIGSQALNLTVQVHWYDAACDFVKDRKLAGVYWWNVNFDADPANAQATGRDRLTFVGKPAANAIKACFSQLSN